MLPAKDTFHIKWGCAIGHTGGELNNVSSSLAREGRRGFYPKTDIII